MSLDERQVCGRHCKAYLDRTQLIDLYQRIRRVRAHQVALSYEETPGAPRDGSADGGVLEVESSLFDRCLACRQRSLGSCGVGSNLLILLGGDVLLLHQRLIALCLLCCVRRLGAVAVEDG